MVMEPKKVNGYIWIKWSEEPPKNFYGETRFIHTRETIYNPYALLQAYNNPHEIEWLKSVEDVYILTEEEFERIKEDEYQKGFNAGYEDEEHQIK